MKLNILFEDDNIIAINKEAGMSVHRSANNSMKEKTVADLILESYPELENVGEIMEVESKDGIKKIPRPGIVHRLDRDTSGVLLIAKNQQTYEMLKEQFKNHKIKKTYRAFVYGVVKDPKASLKSGKRGIIKAVIGRSKKDIRMWTAGRGAKEPVRDAWTEYNVLQRFKKGDHYFSYLELYPKTGRTHQLRVHLRYISNPIVSDPIYASNRERSLEIDRLALHSKKIVFALSNGDLQTVEAPYPKDFQKLIDTYII